MCGSVNYVAFLCLLASQTMKWESSTAKVDIFTNFAGQAHSEYIPQAQLRFTSQRLSQEQAKHNSQATLTRADIATLLQQGNVLLAREKAEKLIQEDGFNDVLEVVEVELGVILERFQELEERRVIIDFIRCLDGLTRDPTEPCQVLPS